MDTLTELLIEIAASAPLLAITMYFHYQYRADTIARIERLEEQNQRHRERERNLTDKSIDKLFNIELTK